MNNRPSMRVDMLEWIPLRRTQMTKLKTPSLFFFRGIKGKFVIRMGCNLSAKEKDKTTRYRHILVDCAVLSHRGKERGVTANLTLVAASSHMRNWVPTLTTVAEPNRRPLRDKASHKLPACRALPLHIVSSLTELHQFNSRCNLLHCDSTFLSKRISLIWQESVIADRVLMRLVLNLDALHWAIRKTPGIKEEVTI